MSDPLAPARGCINGLLIAAVLWLLFIGLIVMVGWLR